MWLSQYLYSPLCHLEIVDTPRVVDHEGRKLSLLRLRVTVNQKGKTLEQVGRSRRDFIHQLATSMQWRVRDWARKHELLTRLQLTIHQLDCAVGEVVDAAPPSALNANDKFADAFNKLFDTVDEESIKISEALWQNGEEAQVEGKNEEALRLFKQAIEARDGRKVLGLCQDKEAGRKRVGAMRAHVVAMQEGTGLGRAEQIQLAHDMHDLARSLEDTGDLDAAAVMYQQAMEAFQAEYGQMHPKVGSCHANLSNVHKVRNDFEKALLHVGKAQMVYVSAYGRMHEDVALTFNNQGIIYEKLGRYDDAFDAHSMSLEIKIKVLGENHGDVAASYGCLGNLNQQRGNFAKALYYHGKAQQVAIAVHGYESLFTARTFMNQGNALDDLQRFDDALEAHSKALEIRIKVVGEHHLDTAESYLNMAIVYKHQGKYEKALEFYQKDLVITSLSLGPAHPEVAKNKSNIGNLYAHQGKFEEAVQMYQQALDVFLAHQAFGPGHPIVTQVQMAMNIANMCKNGHPMSR